MHQSIRLRLFQFIHHFIEVLDIREIQRTQIDLHVLLPQVLLQLPSLSEVVNRQGIRKLKELELFLYNRGVALSDNLDWYSEGKNCEVSAARHERDVALKCMAEVLTARQPHADSSVVHFVDVLHRLQFQEGHEQHLLSVLADAQTRVDNLCLDDVLISPSVFLRQALNRNDQVSFVLIVLDGILNDVESNQLVLLPVSLHQELKLVLPVEIQLQLARSDHWHELADHFFNVHLWESCLLSGDVYFLLPYLHAHNLVCIVEPHQHARLRNCSGEEHRFFAFFDQFDHFGVF
jgi:hypothetical protein